jgi:hypothetical protein
MNLSEFVCALAAAIKVADGASPVAPPSRTGRTYQPGIGPHTEHDSVTLALAAWPQALPAFTRELPYPASPRTRCDLVFTEASGWAIELKMLRLMGDNGKLNDNMLMHILSPYPAHRSALTDIDKLLSSGFAQRKAVVVFGYDYPGWSMDPAIDAFRLLAGRRAQLTECEPASYDELVHPVHQEGRVFGWELIGTR